MERIKIMLASLIILSLLMPTFVYSWTASIRPGKMIIYADDHPEDVTSAVYSVTVENLNDKASIITLTVSNNIYNYVTLHETNITLQTGGAREIEFDVDLTLVGHVIGDISAMFVPEDGIGFSQGISTSVEIYPRGTITTEPCEGTDYLCGMQPNCMNCAELNGCYDGYYREYHCNNNECKYTSEYCTESCCDEYYGNTDSYCSGNVCYEAVPHAPKINTYSPGDLTPNVEANMSLQFTHSSSDPDGDPLTYSWLLDGSENATTQDWIYYPTPDDVGTHNVTLVVSDGGLTDSLEWTVTVTPEGGLLPDGSSCVSDTDCESQYCVHNVCRSSDPYCGDGYCDSGESCSSCSGDCGSCPVTTTPSSSGGSGGGGGGGGGGGSVKTTGFYNFPGSVEIEAGSSETVSGEFYGKTNLNNVVFTLEGIDESWYEIDPSALDKVEYKETVNINIMFTIPDDATLTTYPLKIYAKTGSLKYNKGFDLIVLAKTETTTETTTTVVTTVPLATEETEQGGVPTGAFAGVTSAITKNWYFIPVPFVVAILIWKLYPILSATSSTKTKGYVSIRLGNEPKTEPVINNIHPQKTVEKTEKEIPKITIDPSEQKRREKTRRKVIDEMRKRALEADKKLKK